MKGDFTRFTFNPKKHYTGVLMQQGRVLLDADWNEQVKIQGHLRKIEEQDIIGKWGAPSDCPGFKLDTTADGQNLTVSSGRMYVNGILCELEEDMTFCEGKAEKNNPGTYLAYLDVWERSITVLEDEDIREKALEGLDTTTRIKTEWRVRLKRCKETSCSGASKMLSDMAGQGNARLAVRLQPPQSKIGGDPCSVISGTAYTGLENQLYRVEVHEPGEKDTATFKWSRNNGAMGFVIEEFIESQNSDTEQKLCKVSLQRLGWDQELRVHEGDLVEILGDETELKGEPGTLCWVKEIDEAKMQLTLSENVVKHKDESHPRIRCWDAGHSKELQSCGAINGFPAKGGWIELENGIEICFKDGDNYQSGDYWLIAARSTGEIEWSYDESYRFSWDKIPGKDNEILIESLTKKFGIDWINAAKIEKIDDGKTIKLSNESNSLSLELSDEKTEGTLRIDDIETDKFIAKIENDELNIYGSIFVEKFGIDHHFCPLAILKIEIKDRGEKWSIESDCRKLFLPLTDTPDTPPLPDSSLPDLAYAGGDGQEAMPGSELPGALRLRVSRCGQPIKGAKVKFSVCNGKGKIKGYEEKSYESEPITVTTKEDGIAQCSWRLGEEELEKDDLFRNERVEAVLTDPKLDHPPLIQFNANACQQISPSPTPPPEPTGGGECCSVKVGDGEDCKTLDDALKKLADKKDICICLLPGEHHVNGLKVSAKLKNLTIRGCGCTTRLISKGQIKISKLDSISFENMEIITKGCGESTAISLDASEMIAVRSCKIQGEGRPLIEIGTLNVRTHNIVIIDNFLLPYDVKEFALVIPRVIEDNAILTNNWIRGELILGRVSNKYSSWPDLNPDNMKKAKEIINKHWSKLRPYGTLQMQSNRLTKVLAGDGLIDQINKMISEDSYEDVSSSIFRQVLLSYNIIEEMNTSPFFDISNQIIGKSVTLTSNWLCPAKGDTTGEMKLFGWVMADCASYTGNSGLDDVQIYDISRKSTDAGNTIGILKPDSSVDPSTSRND